MKFKCKFTTFSLDKAALLKEYDTYFNKHLRKAGIIWLDATVRSPTHIPTWSGASRATFQKLAQALGTSVPIGRIRAVRNRSDWGRAASDGGIRTAGYKYSFYYETSLEYLIFNESNVATPGPYPRPWSSNVKFTPYQFVAKGAKAVEAYASTLKLPDPTKHITRGKMS